MMASARRAARKRPPTRTSTRSGITVTCAPRASPATRFIRPARRRGCSCSRPWSSSNVATATSTDWARSVRMPAVPLISRRIRMLKQRAIPIALVAGAALMGTAGYLSAYPGGTPQAVTNAAPYCATCHSSANAEQLRDQKADAIAAMTVEQRHIGEINRAQAGGGGFGGGYGNLSADDKAKLIDNIKAVDANSKVSIAVSATSVKPGAPLTATVTTRGGGGPVIGVMLTDNDLRFQAGPVQTQGFVITDAPAVTGPDGKPQTKFTDNRMAGLPKGINYVNIYEVYSNIEKSTYPECKVVYSLKAPATPGDYTICAAFLFGTEKASPLGRRETPDGRVLPIGGGGSHSGRVMFASPVKITVK